MKKTAGSKKMIGLKNKYEVTLEYTDRMGCKEFCILESKEKIDLMDFFTANYYEKYTNYLNGYGIDDLSDVTSIFNIFVKFANAVIDEEYPILRETIHLTELDINDSDDVTLSRAKDVMDFIEEYVCGFPISHKVNNDKVYASIKDSCIIKLGDYKVLTITQAEKLIRDKLHMNVLISDEV